MRHAYNIVLFVVSLTIGSVADVRSQVAGKPETGEIKVTLAPDGEHCIVRAVTILCSELAAHLRDKLKLPDETLILLRADRAAPYQSVRRLLDIIEKSGFSYPVPLAPKPK